MQSLIVRFATDGPQDAEFERHCDEVASMFARIPGLAFKLWLQDTGGVWQGVYVFFDRAALEAYLASPLFAEVRSNPAIELLDVRRLRVLERPSRVTRALPPAPERLAPLPGKAGPPERALTG